MSRLRAVVAVLAVFTAGEAFAAGATHIVVGRPVTRAADPAAAFARIAADARGER